VNTRSGPFVIDSKEYEKHGEIVDRLWRGAGLRILMDYVQRLRDGHSLEFSGLTVRDDGVVIKRRQGAGSPDYARLSWPEVRVWSAAGYLIIAKDNDRSFCATLPFRGSDNVVVLDSLISASSKSGKARLSQMFD
jgi:hypothetical protein